MPLSGLPIRRTAWTAALVCAGCWLGATAGMRLRFPQLGTAVVFAPYAILTAALLLASPKRWWIYLLAASLGNVAAHRAAGELTAFALWAELANHTRALVAAYGIRRFGGDRARFDTFWGMAAYLFFAALLAPVAGACIGAGGVHWLRGGEFWSAWRAWLFSNTLTALTLLPILLIALERLSMHKRFVAPRRLVEASALALTLAAVGWFAFEQSPKAAFPTPIYAPVPLLLWAAVRFGPSGTIGSLLLVAILTIGGALGGRGPFATQSPADDLAQLQLFLFVISVPLLLLSSLMREQRRTASALLESQRQYRTIVEDQTELICRFRPDGVLTFGNAACVRSSRRAARDLVGSAFWLFVPEKRRDATKQIVARLGADHPLATWEQELAENGAESRWEQWSVRAICDDRGRVVDYQAVGRDITEKKRAEEQRRLLDAERALASALREADRRKDEFLALLAHELRNPLAPISMVLDFIDIELAHDAKARWAREIIGRQLGQLTRLVGDLLDISRITSGKIQVEREAIDLAEVIANAVEACRPLIATRNVDLTVRVPDRRLRVRGDAARLTQLVSNLLNNAAKYTDKGGRIGLTAAREAAHIAVRVTDTGVGIPADMLERVFEPFIQVSRSRDSALGGLGLGLNLVKRLVELHEGTVEAHSEGPGRGSEFVVRLPALEDTPIDRPAVAPALPQVAEPVVGAVAASTERAAPPVRQVLVVDDAVEAAESLASLISLQGHDVHVAHDGPSALDAALRLGPKIVFLDLGLPQMDGLEVARLLRRRFGSGDMLLVATTGLARFADRRRTSEAGFDHHLTKPLDRSTVEALLATCAAR